MHQGKGGLLDAEVSGICGSAYFLHSYAFIKAYFEKTGSEAAQQHYREFLAAKPG